ncbi:hypothetical protein HK101_007981 [Irineochytrium annulatum]|nr:hypothetical protein HK101_007981 [Irineochytrium annulatum]
MAESFDWYISPSDRFARESEFAKLCKNGEDSLACKFLSFEEDFVQIWALVSLSAPTINQEQFVYFKHILDSRRKGKPLPIGVPLNIKEAFLKERAESKVFTRTILGTRDPGASSTKDIATIQVELRTVEEELKTAEEERLRADDKIAELSVAKDEFEGLANYKKRHLAAIKDDIGMLKEGQKQLQSGSSGPDPAAVASANELLAGLKKDRQFLEQRKADISRALEAANAELARER